MRDERLVDGGQWAVDSDEGWVRSDWGLGWELGG